MFSQATALLGTAVLAWSTVLAGSTALWAAESRPPNVVLILTDNHGAWTLGCYGNPDIKTPNLDRLASEGMLFTHCFSSNAVCSPTRATLLTGLIPSQHGVHTWLKTRGGVNIGPEAYNTIEEFRSLPEILSESGYVCGLSGKWHLGDSLHPHEGFSYWVTKPYGHTVTFYNAEVVEDGKIRKEPSYTTDFWTDRAVQFIEQNKEKPFFLLLAYNGPYGLGQGFVTPNHNRPSPYYPAYNRHDAYYADKELPSFPREPVHEWLNLTRRSINNIYAIRRYAAEVTGVDDGVGRIMHTLNHLGLDENTLVIFTADQGLAGGHHGMWGMGDHSRPLHTFDGTMHIPLICRQPKRIPAGWKSDKMVANYDMLPTVLSYVGLTKKIPNKPELPGRDFSPVLRGKPLDWDNVIFYEFENCRVIRTAEWKYTRRHPDGPDELYDLANDPGERKNLVEQPRYTTIKKQLHKRLEAFFDRYADPKYNLQKGGGSKSHLLLERDKPRLRPGTAKSKSPKP